MTVCESEVSVELRTALWGVTRVYLHTLIRSVVYSVEDADNRKKRRFFSE